MLIFPIANLAVESVGIVFGVGNAPDLIEQEVIELKDIDGVVSVISGTG